MLATLIGLLIFVGCVLGAFEVAKFFIDRNHEVYNYRIKLINQIENAIGPDRRKNGEVLWRWRYQVYDTVSYDAMLYKFWKKLDSFYPDMKFTQSYEEIYKDVDC